MSILSQGRFLCDHYQITFLKFCFTVFFFFLPFFFEYDHDITTKECQKIRSSCFIKYPLNISGFAPYTRVPFRCYAIRMNAITASCLTSCSGFRMLDTKKSQETFFVGNWTWNIFCLKYFPLYCNVRELRTKNWIFSYLRTSAGG